MDAEQPPPATYRFDCFTLDLARGALLALDGAELPLRPKSFALLQLFVENAGQLLDRDTIMQAVWPDVFVTDDSITQCVRRDPARARGRGTAPAPDPAAARLPLRRRGGARSSPARLRPRPSGDLPTSTFAARLARAEPAGVRRHASGPSAAS